jgi:hypothetical protein
MLATTQSRPPVIETFATSPRGPGHEEDFDCYTLVDLPLCNSPVIINAATGRTQSPLFDS